MTVEQKPAASVRTIPHVWIPLADGTRLSARVWLPDDAEDHPVPAVLEYIPYRKNDATAPRDELRHPYVAGHGYATVRVDVRGSGDSDGVLDDEYSPRELADAVEVIAWLGKQPWCTGKVGMVGISWGGFNGLQVAALQPPELAGVISVCSTDDRYADDVHYFGGCAMGSELLPWASTMQAWNARPPDPEVVGDSWRDTWLERLAAPPYIETWLAHQRRDRYWEHGSVCEDYDAIKCPVYMVGGWGDPYRTAILRVLENHRGPRKGLIGPWVHMYPEIGRPGPAVGFLQESVKFWDHCLKGEDNGVLDGPMLHAYIQDSAEPATGYTYRHGRWVAEQIWPSPDVAQRRLYFGDQTLAMEESKPSVHTIRGATTAGLDAGTYMPFGGDHDFAPDQRREDGLSLGFVSEILGGPLEVLGTPNVRLEVESDRPLALVAVRLCEVLPDGRSTLITRGLLNLAHRNGHDRPEPLSPGRVEIVDVRLSAIGHRFAEGSRILVSVSPTYWPWAWPSPESATLTVHATGSSALTLPVRSPEASDGPAEPFLPVELGETAAPRPVGEYPNGQRIHQDTSTGSLTIEHYGDRGSELAFEHGLGLVNEYRDEFSIVEEQPLSATVVCERAVEVKREGWHTRVDLRATMTGDADEFHVTTVVEASEDGAPVFARTWKKSLPRDHV